MAHSPDQRRAYCARNRDRLRAQRKIWVEKNREKLRAYDRARPPRPHGKPKDPAKQRAYAAEWQKKRRIKDPGYEARAYAKRIAKPRNRAILMYKVAKKRSLMFGYECTITVDEIQAKLEAGVCEMTGLPFDFSAGNGRIPRSPSLERFDNSRGYTSENVRVVCWQFNAAKQHWSFDTLLDFAHALVARHPLPSPDGGPKNY